MCDGYKVAVSRKTSITGDRTSSDVFGTPKQFFGHPKQIVPLRAKVKQQNQKSFPKGSNMFKAAEKVRG